MDLFSGIGGFAIAVEEVFGEVEHVFCDNDKFCQQVLKKHWPKSKMYGDIKEITSESADLVTGGFPCQPFSQAGKRKGTSDDRYLWPEMLRVIQLAKPTWVVAENVSGILTWDNGTIFEQVCSDLDNQGYQVQAFVIPACAVNAYHRRDRVWIIGYSKHNGLDGSKDKKSSFKGSNSNTQGKNKNEQFKGSALAWDTTNNAKRKGLERHAHSNQKPKKRETTIGSIATSSWDKNWLEVATELCGMVNGLPARLDGFELSESKHRIERIKALGNAIVPQVAIEIMKGIMVN